MINNLSVAGQAKLLEQAVIQSLLRESLHLKYIAIVNMFYGKSFFTEYEPVEDIKRARDFISSRGKGRGRKPKDESKVKPKNFVLSPTDPTQEVVYLHTLYSRDYDRVAYNVVSRTNNVEVGRSSSPRSSSVLLVKRTHIPAGEIRILQKGSPIMLAWRNK